MKQFLGTRSINRNRKNSNTIMLLIPAMWKTITGISFKTKVDIYLIDGKNLLIEVKE